MGLLLQMSDSSSLDNTSNSLAPSDTNHIDHLILAEHLVNSDLLLEKLVSEVDLCSNAAAIDLDFEDVVLLLSEVELVHLGVHNESDHLTVLFDAVQLDIHVFGILGQLLAVLGECLLLGIHPILVETTHGVFAECLSPDGAESAQSSWCLNVSYDSHGNEWGCFDDSHGLNRLLLVQLGANAVHLSQDVGHTSLEPGERCQVNGLCWVVARETSDLSSMLSCALPWGEANMTVPWCLKLPVRHS
jgi:hypothetical protein